MKSASILLLLSLGCVAPLVSCSEKGKPFLTFDDLCDSRAEDICASRTAPCCEQDADMASCVSEERKACLSLRRELEQESALSYDSVRAARVADQERAALLNCESPFPLARFFEGALSEGDACDRDAQCESGVCGGDSQQCESAEAPSLCPAEDAE